jgi:hypothetical protein
LIPHQTSGFLLSSTFQWFLSSSHQPFTTVTIAATSVAEATAIIKAGADLLH